MSNINTVRPGTSEMYDFVCSECGDVVYTFGAPKRTLCMTCEWVKENVPPDYREAVREIIGG